MYICTYIHIYIYIYLCMCIYVCVYIYWERDVYILYWAFPFYSLGASTQITWHVRLHINMHLCIYLYIEANPLYSESYKLKTPRLIYSFLFFRCVYPSCATCSPRARVAPPWWSARRSRGTKWRLLWSICRTLIRWWLSIFMYVLSVYIRILIHRQCGDHTRDSLRLYRYTWETRWRRSSNICRN